MLQLSLLIRVDKKALMFILHNNHFAIENPKTKAVEYVPKNVVKQLKEKV